MEFSDEIRTKKLKRNIKYLVSELIMFVMMSFATKEAWRLELQKKTKCLENDTREIQEDSLIWILVYTTIYAFYVFRRIVIMLYWRCSKNPREKETIFRSTTTLLFLVLEVSWMIYGQIIFKQLSRIDDHLWDIMFFVRIWTWMTLGLYSFLIVLLILILLGMKAYGIFDV